jgi:hypothetical protein
MKRSRKLNKRLLARQNSYDALIASKPALENSYTRPGSNKKS